MKIKDAVYKRPITKVSPLAFDRALKGNWKLKYCSLIYFSLTTFIFATISYCHKQRYVLTLFRSKETLTEFGELYFFLQQLVSVLIFPRSIPLCLT